MTVQFIAFSALGGTYCLECAYDSYLKEWTTDDEMPLDYFGNKTFFKMVETLECESPYHQLVDLGIIEPRDVR